MIAAPPGYEVHDGKLYRMADGAYIGDVPVDSQHEAIAALVAMDKIAAPEAGQEAT